EAAGHRKLNLVAKLAPLVFGLVEIDRHRRQPAIGPPAAAALRAHHQMPALGDEVNCLAIPAEDANSLLFGGHVGPRHSGTSDLRLDAMTQLLPCEKPRDARDEIPADPEPGQEHGDQDGHVLRLDMMCKEKVHADLLWRTIATTRRVTAPSTMPSSSTEPQ